MATGSNSAADNFVDKLRTQDEALLVARLHSSSSDRHALIHQLQGRVLAEGGAVVVNPNVAITIANGEQPINTAIYAFLNIFQNMTLNPYDLSVCAWAKKQKGKECAVDGTGDIGPSNG